MAEQENNNPLGLADVINSVDSASSKELAALSKIEKKLDGHAQPVAGGSASNAPAPRSISRNQARKKEQQRLRREAIKTQANNSDKTGEKRKNITTSGKPAENKQKTNLNTANDVSIHIEVSATDKAGKKSSNSSSKTNEKHANNVSNSGQTFAADKDGESTSKNKDIADLKAAQRLALEQLKASPALPAGGASRGRDANGRFSSGDKAQQNQEAQRERRRDAEEKERNSAFTRIAKVLSDFGDPLDAEGADAAGVAAGGSFWRAGHEIYSGAKSTVQGGYGAVKKMRDVLHPENEQPPAPVDAQPAKNRGFLKRAFSRSPKNTDSSATVVARNAQREQRHAIEVQTQAIQKGDDKIVERLDELLKQHDGKKGGGLSGLLGAAAIGGIGKKLLGGLLTGLGLGGLAEKIRGSKKKPGRAPGWLGGDDCGCDLPGGDRANKRRKPTRKKRREARNAARQARKRERANANERATEHHPDRTRPPENARERVRNNAGSTGDTTGHGAGGAPGATARGTSDTTGHGAGGAPGTTARGTNGTAGHSAGGTPGATDHGAGGTAGAVAHGTEHAATREVTQASEDLAEAGGKKAGAKLAAKAAAKTALRAVPIVGQVLGVGYDAVTGWQNKDGQAKAFDLKEGQEATKRQKAEYTAANIADMGGLVSGGAGLLASGASKLGLGGVAKSLTFSTEDMAKGLDNKISSAKNLATSLSSALGLGALGFSEQAKAEKAADERTTDVVDAVKTGATATTQALSDLAKAFESGSLLKAAANKAEEAAQTVVDFGARTYANIAQPATDAVSPELNIGGSNAKARSFRNNNFGNLQYAGQKGARLENANAYGERRFARFDTPEEGFRSLANQLSSYANGTSSVVGYKKLQSIGEIIPSFAPESENNTKAYMASLSKQLGVGLNDKLDLQNPEVMTKVMRAIATLEGGNPQVTDEFIKNSIGHYQEGSGNKGRGQWVGQFNDSTLPIINQKRQQLGLAPVTKYDQYAGIASVNGKAVDSSLPLASMAALPAAGGQVVQHAQSVKKPGDTASHAISRGGIDYRPATLPMDGTAARAVVDKIGADELRHTEGLRHQVYVASEAESPPESKKIVDAAKEAKAAQVGQVAAARPTGAATVNAGVSFRSAKLGSDDGSVWNTVAKKLGAEHVLNAEGLRHQVNPVDENAASAGRASLSAAAISRPGMAIPVRMPTIQDLSASNVQPTVNVANPQPAFPKEASALLKKINETLEEIRGHTKDAAEKAGDQAPKANTPQPAPRGSVPLSINDPLMASVAGN